MTDRNKTVLVTCTTPGRKMVFDKCRDYVARFEEPHTHLVINMDRDYDSNLKSAFMRLPDGWERLVFIEDDDWYRADWLGICCEMLESFDVVGQDPVRYYQPSTRTHHTFPGKETEGRVHSSLCSTAISRKAYPLLLACLEAQGARWLDMVFWANVKAQAAPLTYVTQDWGAVVGIKGLVENPCGLNHDRPLSEEDKDGKQLVEWVGEEDAPWYLHAYWGDK